jgi:hypothetical protein
MLENDFSIYSPQYKGLLKKIDQNTTKRNELIIYAIKSYGFLLPSNKPFRISFLGQLIRECYDCVENERNKMLSDLLIINGKYLCPFIKTPDGNIRQI